MIAALHGTPILTQWMLAEVCASTRIVFHKYDHSACSQGRYAEVGVNEVREK
jgi:hypothetical protein